MATTKGGRKNTPATTETVSSSEVAPVSAAAIEAPEVNRDNLKIIVDATLDTNRQFVYTPVEVHEPLEKAGLVEVNRSEGFTNAAGEIATRATTKGIEFMTATNANPTTEASAAPSTAPAAEASNKNLFVLDETEVAMPPVQRGGRTGDIYPFDSLVAPGEQGVKSFFVPATAERPNPAKSMASTVASATARYAVKDGDKTRKTKKGNVVPVMIEKRKFVVRSVKENKKIIGARVWRVK